MAFAVTQEHFDSRTIPESYIMLREIPKLPFGASFMEAEKTAELFEEKTPIVMVRNDCVIVTGSSLLNAFDRLEVLEYSAKAVLDAKVLGDLVKIDAAAVTELIDAFHLKN